MPIDATEKLILKKGLLLGLSGIKGIGYWTVYKALDRKDGLENLLDSDTQKIFETKLGHKLGSSDSSEDWNETKEKLLDNGIRRLAWLRSNKTELILPEEKGFPEKLKSIQKAPRWLFYQGNLSALDNKCVGIVGSREASAEGLFLTKYILESLYKFGGISTISGLANGIDQKAHTESLKLGIPTVAVLGTGILRHFPKGSEKLQNDIVEKSGLVISEYFPNENFNREFFVHRNRLQAALSDCLIPVEWKIKSGTAHTVNFALNYQTPVIGIKTPFQSNTYQAEGAFLEAHKCKVVDIPGEEEAFRRELVKSLTQPKNPLNQLSLLI